ncbi:MAG: putative DNA-binding domain-containing protein [Bacteroidetes bacterium]|nr:putative DNA-binding domain-containing protein [Bacteroidota bacterium]
MLRPDTIKIQHDLAMYCRSGDAPTIPGTSEGRLPHYRRLVLNVVSGTISQAYPITRKVLSEEEWQEIFVRFFVEHDAQTPMLWKLPYEYYLYVRDHDYAVKFNKAWLNELLWFEWLEIDVHMMPDEKHEAYTDRGELFLDPLVVNKDSRLIHLEYPVHLYPLAEVEERKGNYYLLIYREQETGTVRFVNFSVLHAWLLERMQLADQLSVKDLLPELLSEFQIQNVDTLENQLNKFLLEMFDDGVILGFRNR